MPLKLILATGRCTGTHPYANWICVSEDVSDGAPGQMMSLKVRNNVGGWGWGVAGGGRRCSAEIRRDFSSSSSTRMTPIMTCERQTRCSKTDLLSHQLLSFQEEKSTTMNCVPKLCRFGINVFRINTGVTICPELLLGL